MKSKNVLKKLARRIKNFEEHPPTPNEIGQGLKRHKPGSQNRRK